MCEKSIPFMQSIYIRSYEAFQKHYAKLPESLQNINYIAYLTCTCLLLFGHEIYFPSLFIPSATVSESFSKDS